MAEIPLTLALSQMEREQEIWLPSPWGEGLGMRAIHTQIQQRPKVLVIVAGVGRRKDGDKEDIYTALEKLIIDEV